MYHWSNSKFLSQIQTRLTFKFRKSISETKFWQVFYSNITPCTFCKSQLWCYTEWKHFRKADVLDIDLHEFIIVYLSFHAKVRQFSNCSRIVMCRCYCVTARWERVRLFALSVRWYLLRRLPRLLLRLSADEDGTKMRNRYRKMLIKQTITNSSVQMS